MGEMRATPVASGRGFGSLPCRKETIDGTKVGFLAPIVVPHHVKARHERDVVHVAFDYPLCVILLTRKTLTDVLEQSQTARDMTSFPLYK